MLQGNSKKRSYMLEKQIVVTHQSNLFVFLSAFFNSTYSQLNFPSITETIQKMVSVMLGKFKFHNLFESESTDPLVYILRTLRTSVNLSTCSHWGNFLRSAEYDTIDI